VTNIVSGGLPAAPWLSRPGVSGPRVGLPGTGVLGSGSGTPPCAAVRSPLPRVWGKAASVAPATQKAAPAVQPGQTNMHNYMTGAHAFGEGASGPPPHREPA
jgi:hypothetical protein